MSHKVVFYLHLQATPDDRYPKKIREVKAVGITQNRPAAPKGTHVVRMVMEIDDEIVDPEVSVSLTNAGGKGANLLSQEVVWDAT